MLTVHWSTILVCAILIGAVVASGRVGKTHGDYDFFSPLLGCGVLLVGIIAALLVLLVRAWGLV
jgi:hypothetical protein